MDNQSGNLVLISAAHNTQDPNTDPAVVHSTKYNALHDISIQVTIKIKLIKFLAGFPA